MSDSYHGSPSRPMEHLKGTMSEVHTQAPKESEAMVNPRSAATGNVGQSWNSTSLEATPKGTGANDGAKAH